MSKNRLQLVRRAVKEMGIVPLSTNTFSSIDELVDGMVWAMQDRNVIDDVFDVTDIDDRMFQPLARCLAYWAAPEMGIDEGIQQRLAAQKAEAEHDLISMQARRPAYKPLKVDYF